MQNSDYFSISHVGLNPDEERVLNEGLVELGMPKSGGPITAFSEEVMRWVSIWTNAPSWVKYVSAVYTAEATKSSYQFLMKHKAAPFKFAKSLLRIKSAAPDKPLSLVVRFQSEKMEVSINVTTEEETTLALERFTEQLPAILKFIAANSDASPSGLGTFVTITRTGYQLAWESRKIGKMVDKLFTDNGIVEGNPEPIEISTLE